MRSASAERRILTHWQYHAQISMPNIYDLQFQLMVHGRVPSLSNILQFTNRTTDSTEPGSRMPAIYMLANSTNIRVEIGGNVTGNFGKDIYQELPLNTWIGIRVLREASRTTITVNNVEHFLFSVQARLTGPAFLWVSNPWMPAANASIRSITLRNVENSQTTLQ